MERELWQQPHSLFFTFKAHSHPFYPLWRGLFSYFSPLSPLWIVISSTVLAKPGGWEWGGIWWGVLEETERGVKGPKIASHHRGWLKRKSSQLCCANLGSGRVFPPLLESLLVHVRCATRRTAWLGRSWAVLQGVAFSPFHTEGCWKWYESCPVSLFCNASD